MVLPQRQALDGGLVAQRQEPTSLNLQDLEAQRQGQEAGLVAQRQGQEPTSLNLQDLEAQRQGQEAGLEAVLVESIAA